MRLRPLTEAECYARCYGGRLEESVGLVWVGIAGDPGDADKAADHESPRPGDPGDGTEAG